VGSIAPVPTVGLPPLVYPDNKQLQGASSDNGLPLQLTQAPVPSPVVQEEYPPVIVLKTGGAFSVTKYWVKNGNLHFVTTQGENKLVPMDLVEQIYPRQKHGQIVPE
jgi:hypothetical protein